MSELEDIVLYGLKTKDGFLAKDYRNNQIEIYESKISAEKAKYNCEVIDVYVFSRKQLNKLKADAVRDYQKYIDQRALSLKPPSVDEYIKNKLERGEE